MTYASEGNPGVPSYIPSEPLRQFEREGDLAFLIELIDCFLEDTGARLQAIEAAAAGDLSALAKQGHTLKGSAANMGLAMLADACQELERSARSGLADSSALERVRSAAENGCRLLRDYRATLAGRVS